MHPIDQITSLFQSRGAAQYGGESVSQLQHALQCAWLAEQSGAASQLVAAALLHDVGHLLHHHAEDAAERGIDDRHELIGSNFLAHWFQDETLDPVRMHVAAKRYLCHAEVGYWDGLSPASKRSLELQGGIHDAADAAAFIAQHHARSAVALRHWDDLAKVPALPTPSLGHFLPHLERSLKVAAY